MRALLSAIFRGGWRYTFAALLEDAQGGSLPIRVAYNRSRMHQGWPAFRDGDLSMVGDARWETSRRGRDLSHTSG